jgi:NAD(P)-dependent dehydrogenase (short-subunit alcohol dehydrogenase family)
MDPASLTDRLLEATVVPSFTRIGPMVRSRLDHWASAEDWDLTGRTVVLTGPTSGLGRAAAEQLARLGATLVLVGRSAERTARTRDELTELTGNDDVSVVVADLGELDQVRRAGAEIAAAHPRVDVLIHNAGALLAERQQTSDGIEVTIASQVLGPFLLTGLLLEQLAAAAPGRVITVSSGGMYTAALPSFEGDDGLELPPSRYRGAQQYALAKRAQVTLNELWDQRFAEAGIVFHAMHPGWADTPGVAESLPTFRRVVGPLLRTPQEGADTIVWLAADDGPPAVDSGGFWLDRRRRSLHKLPTTRRSDTPERRERLWRWCTERTGCEPRLA